MPGQLVNWYTQVRNKVYTDNVSYNWVPQSPGGSLSVGSNTITLSPCPLGLDTSGANGYSVYISGGAGTAECVPVTGGTGTSGAASGTIIVTCANTHTGAWTVRSGSSGIQECANVAGAGNTIVVAPSLTPYPVYCPVNFLLGQSVIARGAIIERNFSSSGNVFNFTAGATTLGGVYGGTFSVNGSFTEPANSYKVYALSVVYFKVEGVLCTGGWGGMFLDNVLRGAMTNISGDTFSGDYIRLGSHANGATGVTISNITTSDNTGTGTAIHAKRGLMNLSNFDLQGLNGQSGTSKGIYFDPDSTDYFDESTIGDGIIDSMANSIQVNPSAVRFLDVKFSTIYISTDGIAGDFPAVSQGTSLTDIMCYRTSGGSGSVFFRGGATLTLQNVRVVQQSMTGLSQSIGIGFLGNITNATIANCEAGYNGDGSPNTSNVASGIFFASATYSGVLVSGGRVPTSNGINISVPSAGITIRNVRGWNPVGTSSISVSASPFTYTAGNSAEQVYISGTITSVTRNGVTVVGALTSGQASVTVPPNASIVVTYGGAAPTMVRDIQ